MFKFIRERVASRVATTRETKRDVRLIRNFLSAVLSHLPNLAEMVTTLMVNVEVIRRILESEQGWFAIEVNDGESTAAAGGRILSGHTVDVHVHHMVALAAGARWQLVTNDPRIWVVDVMYGTQSAIMAQDARVRAGILRTGVGVDEYLRFKLVCEQSKPEWSYD
jgi:hypothetical protein